MLTYFNVWWKAGSADKYATPTIGDLTIFSDFIILSLVVFLSVTFSSIFCEFIALFVIALVSVDNSIS